MDIQETHRVTLLRAKCSYVKSLDVMFKKMSYGEDVDECCARKLFLASQLINRLDCYKFTEKIKYTVTPVTFKSTLLNSTAISASGNIFYLYMNGNVISSYAQSSNQNTQLVLLNLLTLSKLNIKYNQINQSGSNIFNQSVIGFWTIETPCDTISLSISYQPYLYGPLTQVFTTNNPSIKGVCSVADSIVQNCWKNSDLPKLYEVLDNLLQ